MRTSTNTPADNPKKSTGHKSELPVDLEHRLEASRKFNAALIASIGDGIIIINEYGIIADINRAALDMLGYEKNELIDQWFPDVLPSKDKNGDDIPALERPAIKSLITGQAASDITSYIKKDGSLFPVYGTASPFILDGKPRGSIVVFRDVSREVAVERAKDEFVSLASHQLRTPLTSIKIYTEMIRDDKDNNLNEELKSHLQKIEASVIGMMELVDDFLNISKLELGRLELNVKDADLAKIIDNQIERISLVAQENKVNVSFKNKVASSKISTDARLLAEAIYNVLTNAVRYRSSERPRIDLVLSKKGSKFLISIKDNGIGIPVNEQGNVFERLYRAGNAKKNHANGTGLGLYLVKKIIEALRGEIRFESTEGHGSTFFIELPT